MLRIRTVDLTSDGSTDFLGDLAAFLLDGVGTIVPRAALDRNDLRVRNELEQITCLQAQILYAKMTSGNSNGSSCLNMSTHEGIGAVMSQPSRTQP